MLSFLKDHPRAWDKGSILCIAGAACSVSLSRPTPPSTSTAPCTSPLLDDNFLISLLGGVHVPVAESGLAVRMSALLLFNHIFSEQFNTNAIPPFCFRVGVSGLPDPLRSTPPTSGSPNSLGASFVGDQAGDGDAGSLFGSVRVIAGACGAAIVTGK